MKFLRSILVGFVLLSLMEFLSAVTVHADGTEELGPPVNLSLATGSDIRVAGTGLVKQPGVIDFTLPDNAVVKQVLLYWEGQMVGNVPGDDTARLNGSTIVTGTLIGGPTKFFGNFFSSAYRIDITNLNLIQPGYNEVLVDDVNYTRVANGAGIMVIFEDETDPAVINLRDGLDIAYIGFPEPRQTTLAQTFSFPVAPIERGATLTLFVSSVTGSVSGATNEDRSQSLEITVGGVTTIFSNELNSSDDDEWDTKSYIVMVPAGATSLTAQLFSRDDLNTGQEPASLTWIAAVLAVQPLEPRLEIETFTNGADADNSNGPDVPQIAVGEPITWTYRVSNTGSIPFSQNEITVIDDQIGLITDIITRIGNADAVLAPGEIWIYQATGTAQDLAANPPNIAIVQGCNPGGTGISRPTYANVGIVTAQNDFVEPATDADPSHYCNVLTTSIDLEKYTNGEDADVPPGPLILVGDPVNWTYIVTNIGSDTLTNVTVTDNQDVAVSCPQTILEPGQSMTCTATSVVTVGQYANIGSVVGTPARGGPPVTDEDSSHYLGYRPNGAIGDLVFEDGDGDGLQGENPVPTTDTVTVTLYLDVESDGIPDSLLRTITTNNGSYAFTELEPNKSYIIEFAAPARTFTTPNAGDESRDSDVDPTTGRTPPIFLAPNEQNFDIDAGLLPRPAKLGNYVWQDLNMDGIQDIDEPALGNVTVELWRDDNSDDTPDIIVLSQQTKLDGSYRFTNVVPGRYFVKFIPPADYLLTVPKQGADEADSDPDPVTQFTGLITLTAGQENEKIDAGFIKRGDIGDLVWEDTNGNGVQDSGEPGVAGVSVTLWFDNNGDDQPDQQLPPAQQTGNDGRYSFPDLDPRLIYYVKFTSPAGRTLTTMDVPPDDRGDSDANPTTGFTDRIQLAYGEDNTTVDAGLLPAGASVLGNVWLGTNAADTNTGIVSVTVWLKDTDGTRVIATTTSSEGHYAFVELLPKTYLIEVDASTLPEQVTPIADRDDPPLGTVTVTLDVGQVLTDVYFLYGTIQPPVQISGRVWPDNNGNRQQDFLPQDPFDESTGLFAWQVLLKSKQEALITAVETSPLGQYTFTNVISGTYIVEVVPSPKPYRQTFDPDGVMDHKTVITVTAGQNYSPVDFGFQPLSYIAGLVWQDPSTRDPLPGTGLILTDTNGTPISTTTNAAGRYEFTSLPPVTYTVCVNTVTLPPGSKQVVDPDGVLDNCRTLSLLPGQDRANVNFGYEVPPPGLALSCQINGVAATPDPEPSVLTSATATWAYQVINRSDRPLSNVSIVDPPLTIDQCGTGRLEPNGSTTCVAEKSVNVGRQVAFVQAKALDDANNEVRSLPQPCYYTGYTADIKLRLLINNEVAEPNNSPYVVQSSPITWVHEVRNMGTATLTNVLISAADGDGGLPDNGNVCPIAVLSPDATESCAFHTTAQSGLQIRHAQATGQPVDTYDRPLEGRITATAQGDYYGGVPTLVLRPPEAEQPIGLLHMVTASLTIAGEPVMAGLPVHFQVIPQGEEALPSETRQTNAKGVATFSYRNTDNRQARTDTIIAWLNVNPITAAALDLAGPSPEDIVDDAIVQWRQIALTNTDTLSSVPEPVRVVTAYVATKDLPEKDGHAVAGLRVGFTAKLGSGEVVAPVFGTTDELGRVPFTITADRVIVPTAANVVSTASLSAENLVASAAQPLIGVTDLITLWVDIDADSVLGVGEPFELVDATTNLPYASFSPKRTGDAVSLTWSTSVANQYAGFNLYRSTAENELGSKLNSNPIGQDENSPFLYSYADTLPGKGVYYYWLEAIGYDNRADKPIGPFLVIWGEELYLPVIYR